MDAIRGQIRDLFAKADEEGRKKIQEELRELQTSLDTEWDMLVRVSSGFMQMALVKIGIDLRIFETLANSAEPVTLDQLAEKSGAAPTLLGMNLTFCEGTNYTERNSRPHSPRSG